MGVNLALAGAGGRGNPSTPSAPPRLGLAVAAAVLLHVALFSSSRPAGPVVAVTAAVPVRSITVRAIASEAPPGSASPATADTSVARPAAVVEASSRAEPATAVTKVAEAKPSTAPAASSSAPEPPLTARSPPMTAMAPAATPAPLKKDAAERVMALPAAPDYLLGAALDPGPQPLGDIEPEYPASANLQEGRVVIRVLISDAGRVDNVAVVRSAPPGLFEAAALEAFGKALFTPARAAGVAVKSQITVEVHFLPINRGSRISGRSY